VGSAANQGGPSGGPTEPGASNSEPVSPQLARARQATEAMWDRVGSEFGLLTEQEVAELLGAGRDNRSYAASKRTARKVIGVRRGTAVLYPGFQFDREHGGAVLEVIEPLIRLADANKWSLEDLALWMCSPSTSFPEEDRPVDHLQEPEAVLAAAKNVFEAEW
jgi:hypothetical protein